MRGDEGSVPVEFALVSVLVVAVFLAVLQLGFTLHVRNTLEAAAADGARYGAVEGRTPADAVERTRDLVAEALTEGYARDVGAATREVDGVPTVVVDVRATLPVIGPWGPDRRLHVRARAFAESP